MRRDVLSKRVGENLCEGLARRVSSNDHLGNQIADHSGGTWRR